MPCPSLPTCCDQDCNCPNPNCRTLVRTFKNARSDPRGTAQTVHDLFVNAVARYVDIQSMEAFNVVNMLMAHSALETTLWWNCYNNNFGGIMWTGGQFFIAPSWDGQLHTFQVFASPGEGLQRYVDRIHDAIKAWDAATQGDPYGYADELLKDGYITKKDYDNNFPQSVSNNYANFQREFGRIQVTHTPINYVHDIPTIQQIAPPPVPPDASLPGGLRSDIVDAAQRDLVTSVPSGSPSSPGSGMTGVGDGGIRINPDPLRNGRLASITTNPDGSQTTRAVEHRPDGDYTWTETVWATPNAVSNPDDPFIADVHSFLPWTYKITRDCVTDPQGNTNCHYEVFDNVLGATGDSYVRKDGSGTATFYDGIATYNYDIKHGNSYVLTGVTRGPHASPGPHPGSVGTPPIGGSGGGSPSGGPPQCNYSWDGSGCCGNCSCCDVTNCMGCGGSPIPDKTQAFVLPSTQGGAADSLWMPPGVRRPTSFERPPGAEGVFARNTQPSQYYAGGGRILDAVTRNASAQLSTSKTEGSCACSGAPAVERRGATFSSSGCQLSARYMDSPRAAHLALGARAPTRPRPKGVLYIDAPVGGGGVSAYHPPMRARPREGPSGGPQVSPPIQARARPREGPSGGPGFTPPVAMTPPYFPR